MNCRVHKISFSPPLSLAMYKELAAHLGQVPLLKAELCLQNAKEFDYNDSQIAAIDISYSHETEDLVQKILNHYGAWHELDSKIESQNSNLLFQL